MHRESARSCKIKSGSLVLGTALNMPFLIMKLVFVVDLMLHAIPDSNILIAKEQTNFLQRFTLTVSKVTLSTIVRDLPLVSGKRKYETTALLALVAT